MALGPELTQLEKDFLSGRNPLAYIPLCQALRKQKLYARALELCQRGLAGDPNSVAGRTLFARLLSDAGNYEDSLREVARMELQAPGAMGLLTEKARALIHLKRFPEAEETLRLLDAQNPLDPQVQMLKTQYRQAVSSISHGVATQSRDAVPRLMRLNSRDILENIVREMKGVAKLHSCAVIPIGHGEPALEGQPVPAETAYTFYREATQASTELDSGKMRLGIVETAETQLIVLVRHSYIVAFSCEPTQNLGKTLHRLQVVVGQMLPEEPRNPGTSEE